MLIELDKTIVSRLDEDTVLISLQNIAIGRREGKHLLFGSREVMGALAKCERISEPARRIFLKIHSHLPQIMAYVRLLKVRVRVMGDGTPLGKRREGSADVILVPLEMFSDSLLVQKVVLLCENQEDTRFYRKIAEAYSAWYNLGTLALAYEPRGGGGATTAKEYSEIQNGRNRMCICIVDSDKKSPSSPLGSTAKAVADADDSGVPICDVAIINVRELENLIPTGILDDLSRSNLLRGRMVEFIDMIEQSGKEDIRFYVDMKNGLKMKTVYRSNSADPFRAYWLARIALLKHNLHHISPDCFSRCLDCDECKSIVCSGFGPSILGEATEEFNKMSARGFTRKIGEIVKEEWEIIGAKIVSWCCGSVPMFSA